MQSLRYSKQLIRDAIKNQLHDINRKECTLLEERWTSEECMNAIMTFFAEQTKKKQAKL